MKWFGTNLPDEGICTVNDAVEGLDAGGAGAADGSRRLIELSLLQLHALESTASSLGRLNGL